ncbi:uncharacterized protein LOC131014649 isoform X2 [Salvia miltiorrhiza]|uniref:uncharacterized protein LOC131014649 isoform X2 n=1 Tax=Salvia miltiorrhiza TaxID=226208 RepID=UPI0025ABB149|nr:uncharacterized protein LOC131014649 isoform X2 [Salvia miltiorrhiza]
MMSLRNLLHGMGKFTARTSFVRHGSHKLGMLIKILSMDVRLLSMKGAYLNFFIKTLLQSGRNIGRHLNSKLSRSRRARIVDLSLLVQAREKNISIADAHYDTFMRMHFKKGQFDGRAQTQGLEIHSRVEELRSTLGRDVTPDEVSQIYREVVTPDPKGRRLGLGIMSQMRSTGSTSTHSTCSSQFPSAAVSAQIAQLQTELEQTQHREATLQATLQAEVQERRRKEAEMKTRQLEMQQQISQLMKFFQSSSGSFPRSSSPP